MKIASFGRISLTSWDAEGLSQFYQRGLGFLRVFERTISAETYGVEGQARQIVLALGEQQLEIVQFERQGAAYPQPCASNDPWFQHFAIVVSDVVAALAQLQAIGQCVPISRNGPVLLPASSGGVTACKLRDPELHPFELLEFPSTSTPPAWQRQKPELHLGIDHSAIVVADTGRAQAFYAELGLLVSAHSINIGPEQDRLDGLDEANVEVTGLSPDGATTPHLELLCYRTPQNAATRAIAANDVAATRYLVRTVDGKVDQMLEDPDRHHLLTQGSALHPLGPQAPDPC